VVDSTALKPSARAQISGNGGEAAHAGLRADPRRSARRVRPPRRPPHRPLRGAEGDRTAVRDVRAGATRSTER
jgi:hypothetical protein